MLRRAEGFAEWVLSMAEGRAKSARERQCPNGEADKGSLCSQQKPLQPQSGGMEAWRNIGSRIGGDSSGKRVDDAHPGTRPLFSFRSRQPVQQPGCAQTLERHRSQFKHKWKGPTRSVGSSPFMPDYDLERSEAF